MMLDYRIAISSQMDADGNHKKDWKRSYEYSTKCGKAGIEAELAEIGSRSVSAAHFAGRRVQRLESTLLSSRWELMAGRQRLGF
jgi:hypothetical protein